MAQGADLIQLPKPTIGQAAIETASQATGSVLIDTAIGAGIGYLIAPEERKRTAYAVGGGLATGVAGLLGLAGLLVVRYAANP